MNSFTTLTCMSPNIEHTCHLSQLQLSWNCSGIIRFIPFLGNPSNLSNLNILTYTFPNIRPTMVTIMSFLSHTCHTCLLVGQVTCTSPGRKVEQCFYSRTHYGKPPWTSQTCQDSKCSWGSRKFKCFYTR